MTTPASVQLKGLPKRPDDFGKPQPDAPLFVDLRGLQAQPKGEQEYLDRMARLAVEQERAKLGPPAAEPPKEEAKVTAAEPTLEQVLEEAKRKYWEEQEAKKPKVVVVNPDGSEVVGISAREVHLEGQIMELLAFRAHYAATLRQLADLLEQ